MGEEEEKECPACTAFCSLLGGNKKECEKIVQKYEDGEVSREDLDKALKEKYGTAAVDLAKQEIVEALDEVEKKLAEERR